MFLLYRFWRPRVGVISSAAASVSPTSDRLARFARRLSVHWLRTCSPVLVSAVLFLHRTFSGARHGPPSRLWMAPSGVVFASFRAASSSCATSRPANVIPRDCCRGGLHRLRRVAAAGPRGAVVGVRPSCTVMRQSCVTTIRLPQRRPSGRCRVGYSRRLESRRTRPRRAEACSHTSTAAAMVLPRTRHFADRRCGKCPRWPQCAIEVAHTLPPSRARSPVDCGRRCLLLRVLVGPCGGVCAARGSICRTLLLARATRLNAALLCNEHGHAPY